MSSAASQQDGGEEALDAACFLEWENDPQLQRGLILGARREFLLDEGGQGRGTCRTMDFAIFNAALLNSRKPEIRLPWEESFGQYIFGRETLETLDTSLDRSVRRRILQDDMAPEKHSEVKEWQGLRPFESRRLLAARLYKSDDHLQSLALKRMRSIVLFHPEDSQLGRSLITASGELVGEDELRRTFMDAFRHKAVGTMAKRTVTLYRFATWQVKINKGRPLAPTERDLYTYLDHLRAQGAGATSGAAFIQTWNFCCATVGVDGMGLISGRTRGVAHDMFLGKRMLKQAPPLSVDTMMRMQKLVCESEDPKLATVAGFMLFCAYASSRFSDAAKAGALRVERHMHIFVGECDTGSYKTAITKEKQTTFLPLMALGSCLYHLAWLKAWESARGASGASRSKFLMPADSAGNDEWLDRAMTTAEGSLWLRDILVSTGMDATEAEAFSTHSLKATCLSWAAKAGSLSPEELLLMGHHSPQGEKSRLVYSRDALADVMVKLWRVVDSIRKGHFEPDASRAKRIAMATGLQVPDGLLAEETVPEEPHEDDASDVSQVGDLANDGMDCPAPDVSVPKPRVLDVDPEHCVRHILSGFVHVKRRMCRPQGYSSILPQTTLPLQGAARPKTIK